MPPLKQHSPVAAEREPVTLMVLEVTLVWGEEVAAADLTVYEEDL